jgi:hypothetical protein
MNDETNDEFQAVEQAIATQLTVTEKMNAALCPSSTQRLSIHLLQVKLTKHNHPQWARTVLVHLLADNPRSNRADRCGAQRESAEQKDADLIQTDRANAGTTARLGDMSTKPREPTAWHYDVTTKAIFRETAAPHYDVTTKPIFSELTAL